MNTKIRNFITPLLLISCFYINASLNQIIDIIGSLPQNAPAQTPSTPAGYNTTIPASANSLIKFVLPAGSSIETLWFSPNFKGQQGTWAAQLPFHNAGEIFTQVNAAAMQGHTIAFKFQIIENNEGKVNGMVTAFDLSTPSNQFEPYAFNDISVYNIANTSNKKNLSSSDGLSALEINYTPTNGQGIIQSVPVVKGYQFAVVPGPAESQISTTQLVLHSNTITNLTVVALNGAKTPSTYFNNAWNGITNAVTTLTAGQSIPFTIGQNNVTCTNASLNIPATLLLEKAPKYLVIAEDGTGYISAAVTNSTFSISVNSSAPNTAKSNIILPAGQYPIKMLMMLTTTGTQGQYEEYAYLPTYLSAGSQWMNVFNALKTNISMTNPLEVTMSGSTVNFSSAGGNIATLNLTNTNQTAAPYILVAIDENGDFHYAIMDSDGKIIIQVKS